jgi:hypothetical protein
VYAFDPTLVMTRDGGRSWSRVRGPQVESLVSSGSTVFRLAYRHTGCPGPCHAVIERSTAGSAVWERMAMTKALRGGYGESESLVAAGSSLYAFAWGRIAGGLTSHARIVVSHDLGRRWSVRGDPCGGSRLRENDAFRATAAGHVLAILCEAKDGSGAAFTALSSDRGMTFVRGGPIPVAAPVQIAVNARGELAVGNGGIVGDGTFHYRLALSTDRGRSWRVALRDREPLTSDLAPGSLQYSSARDLSWVGYPHVIWLTSDAGLTWRKSRPAALRPSRG